MIRPACYRSILAAVAGIALFTFAGSTAFAATEFPPHIPTADVGALVEDVTVETYGVVKPDVAMQYLSVRKGDRLDQSGVDRDYLNLTSLGGLRPRLQILHTLTGGVALHWIVMAKWLEPTAHPFYASQPLSIPIEGVGWIVTSPQLDSHGSTLSTYSQLAARADLVRVLYTHPLSIDPQTGRESDLILNTFGGRGVVRLSQPLAVNVYSWFTGFEALYLVHATGGTQVEFGVRETRSTSDKSTYITAPSVYDTFAHPARSTALEAGASHGCPVPPWLWHPPYCYVQYRVQAVDAIGGLGATSTYHAVIADMARYVRVGTDTFVVHGAVYRTGGVVPTSGLVCATGLHAYAKGTCGTDANVVQGEYRFADAKPGLFKFFLFEEAASSRVRGGTQYFTPPNFVWRSDTGGGIMYRGVRLDLAYGNQGGRITYELQGQLF